MQISFDPRNSADIQFVEKLLAGLSSSGLAEPVVAQNPGSAVVALASLATDCAGGVEASVLSQTEASAPVTNNVVNLREVSPDDTLDQTAAKSKAPCKDDCTKALKAFTAKEGMDAGLELLKKFKVSRVGELDPSDYSDFLAKCC